MGGSEQGCWEEVDRADGRKWEGLMGGSEQDGRK